MSGAASPTTRPWRTGASPGGTTTAVVVIASARGHATAIRLSRSPLSGAVASQMHQQLALASPKARPRRQRDSPRRCLWTHALLRWRLRSSSRKSSCPVLVPLPRRRQASAAGAPDCRHSSAEAEAAASAAAVAAAAHRRASRRRRMASRWEPPSGGTWRKVSVRPRPPTNSSTQSPRATPAPLPARRSTLLRSLWRRVHRTGRGRR